MTELLGAQKPTVGFDRKAKNIPFCSSNRIWYEIVGEISAVELSHFLEPILLPLNHHEPNAVVPLVYVFHGLAKIERAYHSLDLLGVLQQFILALQNIRPVILGGLIEFQSNQLTSTDFQPIKDHTVSYLPDSTADHVRCVQRFPSLATVVLPKHFT